jgi:hypothetical protein
MRSAALQATRLPFFFFFLKKLHTNVPFLNGVQLTITSVLTKKTITSVLPL